MSGYTKGAATVIQALQKVEDERETIWSDAALLTVADLSPVDSMLARALRSDAVWDRSMREQLRAAKSGKPGTEHLRPRSMSGLRLQSLLERAEKFRDEAGDSLLSERHLAMALADMLRDDFRAQAIDGERLAQEVDTLERSPERKKVEEALELEHFQFAKLQDEMWRKAAAESSDVQTDAARRGLMGSGVHIGGVIAAHTNMLRAMAHERVPLRMKMIGTVPELGTPVHLDRLKQEIEAMVDAQWANLHIAVAPWCGGVSAEAEVRRLIDASKFADAPLQIKSEAARELEMLKREIALGMREQPDRPEVLRRQHVGEDPASDAEIIRRLERLNPSLAGSYRQVLADVQDAWRSTWKGTANELREVLREVLDTLAPDGEVRQRDWFQQARASASTQQDRDRGPTHAEKVRFILERRAGIRSPEVATTQEAVREIETRLGQVVRAVYTRTSAAAHVQKDREEIGTVLRYARAVLLELLPE